MSPKVTGMGLLHLNLTPAPSLSLLFSVGVCSPIAGRAMTSISVWLVRLLLPPFTRHHPAHWTSDTEQWSRRQTNIHQPTVIVSEKVQNNDRLPTPQFVSVVSCLTRRPSNGHGSRDATSRAQEEVGKTFQPNGETSGFQTPRGILLEG
jgi:hypothetical protein